MYENNSFQGFIYTRLSNLSITWVFMKKCAIYLKNNTSMHVSTKIAGKIVYFFFIIKYL